MSAPPERPTPPRIPAAWPIPLAIAALAAVQLTAFRWGVILPDTVLQYGQVLSGRYEDWHPPVTAWLWRQIGGARFGSAPLLLLDMALYWTGFGLIAGALRRGGRIRVAWRVLLIAALPIPFGAIGSILKDSLLTACLVCASGMIGRQPIAGSPAPALRIMAVPLVVLAAAARFNGAFAAAPLLLACLPRPPRRPPAILLGCAASLLLLFGTSTLINRVALQPRQTQPFLSLVNLDLAGISLVSGDDVYPADAQPPRALLARCYTPAIFNLANDPDCNGISDGLCDHFDAAGTSVLRVWLGAIARHPIAYATHRFRHFNANQRWLERQVPADAIFLMSADNHYGLAYHVTPLAWGIYRAATIMAASPLGRPATWLAVAIGLLLASRQLRLPPLARWLALSAMLYAAAYLVVSVAPDMRYNVWTMIAAMLALLLALADRPPRRALLIAGIAPALAVIGELAAIAIG